VAEDLEPVVVGSGLQQAAVAAVVDCAESMAISLAIIPRTAMAEKTVLFYFALTKNLFQMASNDRLTPIQRYGIALVNDGFDMLACAQTGSDKTVAFLLPTLSKLFREEHASTTMVENQSPCTIIIVPTRKLAVQIYNEGRKVRYQIR
jgi:Rad3-related DNA helicase